MVIGYILAFFIGGSLGLLGGGGSILTVPVLVYILNIPAKEAVALSLAIVGFTSLIGSMGHLKAGNIDKKIALIFAPTAMIGTYLGTYIASFLTGQFQLLLFSIVMIAASYFMFKDKKELPEGHIHKTNIPLVIIVSVFVGILTGIVGVGGGFMIVPALVILADTPMKKAVGTSLVIISLNSLSGFIGYINKLTIDWQFLGIFTSLTAIGILVGSYAVKYISQRKLKKIFAIFLIIMGILILYKNRQVFL